jgi:hypothetical protein
MTSDQIASLLELAEAKKGEGGWLELGLHHLTLHTAYNGASLSLARIEGVKLVGPMVHARGPRGEIHVVRVEDVFAGSVEPLKEKGRKAGFV